MRLAQEVYYSVTDWVMLFLSALVPDSFVVTSLGRSRRRFEFLTTYEYI